MNRLRTRKSYFLLGVVWLLLPCGAAYAQTRGADGPVFRPGVLPTSWPHGGRNCARVPEFGVHRYNDDLYIPRQSGCTNFEKGLGHLLELNEALSEMKGGVVKKVMRDFTIWP